jgi:hypothetical protein
MPSFLGGLKIPIVYDDVPLLPITITRAFILTTQGKALPRRDRFGNVYIEVFEPPRTLLYDKNPRARKLLEKLYVKGSKRCLQELNEKGATKGTAELDEAFKEKFYAED